MADTYAGVPSRSRPGSELTRGRALHQDNFYVRVEPGTCVATCPKSTGCTA